MTAMAQFWWPPPSASTRRGSHKSNVSRQRLTACWPRVSKSGRTVSKKPPLSRLIWSIATAYSMGQIAKQLSYRRETALHGGSVLAKSGRRYSADNIGLSPTTVTWEACKAIKLGEIKQNKGYYTVQGHSRSSRSVPIERRWHFSHRETS